MSYLWLKAFHIMAVVTWFAALFYLPRLFVYHTLALNEQDTRGSERFKVMERKLYRGIMTPSLIVLVLLGIGLWSLSFDHYWSQGWFRTKLLIMALLIIYHFWCARLLADFAQDSNRKTHVWYRVFNEVPVLGLIAIVLLAVLKPW